MTEDRLLGEDDAEGEPSGPALVNFAETPMPGGAGEHQPKMDPDDAATLQVYDSALADFVDALNRLHIEFGAPSYSAITKASKRTRLTKPGINEALSGKRLPSVDFLVEFVRVVTNALPPDPEAPPNHQQHPALVKEWRERWVQTKYLHRRAQIPLGRLRDASNRILDEAVREAEKVRTAAREEAAQVREKTGREISALARHEQSTAGQDRDVINEAAGEAGKIRIAAVKKAEQLLQQAEQERTKAIELQGEARRLRDQSEQLRAETVADCKRIRANTLAQASALRGEAEEKLAKADSEADRKTQDAEAVLKEAKAQAVRILESASGKEMIAAEPAEMPRKQARVYRNKPRRRTPEPAQPRLETQGERAALIKGLRDRHGEAAADFSPFWFAVTSTKTLISDAGDVVGELEPGIWYLAVEAIGTALVAHLADGRRGILLDTVGIQRDPLSKD